MIAVGDCVETMRRMQAGTVQVCVTSPPYFGLRDYGHEAQIGLEETPAEYVRKMVDVFTEVHRLLRDDGTLWLNLGDSYVQGGRGAEGAKCTLQGSNNRGRVAAHAALAAMGGKISGGGLKPKQLLGIPWRVAFALQDAGWYLRQEIIWSKPNLMPESVTDRCTKSHEHIFLLSKGPRYYFDHEAIKEPAAGVNNYSPRGGPVPGKPDQSRKRESVKRGGFNGKTNAMPGREAFRAVTDERNKRSVWTVATRPFREAHFATFPEQLIEPCILAGSAAGQLVFDPFMGAGTTAVVAERLGRSWAGCELNPEYAEIAERRIKSNSRGLQILGGGA